MIEKLEPRRFGPDFGYGGATFSDVIDKVNEIIDAMNGEHDPADIYSEDGRLIAKYNESEDERMIRKIESFLSAYGADYFSNDEWREIENWLEKQKENPKNADSIPEDCVSNAKCEDRSLKHSDSFGTDIRDTPAYWRGWDDAMKQKEQNGEDEECTDFTIYHPLKNGKGKYECIPYSFYGSLTSFSEDKDLIDFLRTCFYTEEECNEWIEQQKEQKPAWSEEDEKMLKCCLIAVNHYEKTCNIGNHLPTKFNIDGYLASVDKVKSWLKSLRPQPKQEPSEKEIEGMVNERATKSGTTKSEMDFYRNGIKDAIKRFSLSPSWKPSEKKKKETLDGADIGYGLETAIDILENGFTHYQTDDGEYERKQALDVLIFLLNETRKKEDAKLWSKDIVESIVTWATEKLQLYSMKESTPYVEAVKNNAQKVLDWAKEQWPIYYGWKPSKERMDRECSFYIDQVYSARNGILRKAFAKMAWIYYRRYEYYLKKCTGYGLRKSIQETTGEDGNLPKGNGKEAWPNTVSTMED